jgi:hypothetical protein
MFNAFRHYLRRVFCLHEHVLTYPSTGILRPPERWCRDCEATLKETDISYVPPPSSGSPWGHR